MAHAVVLINPFRVKPGHEAAFRDLFAQTHAIFREKPGYLSTTLHEALPDQPPGEHAPYTHINIARWASFEAYAEALKDPRLRVLGGRYLQHTSLAPALYAQVFHDAV